MTLREVPVAVIKCRVLGRTPSGPQGATIRTCSYPQKYRRITVPTRLASP